MTRESKSLNNTRRDSLRWILAGSALGTTAAALPAKWARPVVDTVVLPAHAQTSACTIAGVYCYVESNNDTVEITIGADGSVNVVFANEHGTWDSTQTNDSVPVTGGHFSVTVTKQGDRSDYRIIRGDVVCNSDTIENGEFENQKGVIRAIYPAKSNCPID